MHVWIANLDKRALTDAGLPVSIAIPHDSSDPDRLLARVRDVLAEQHYTIRSTNRYLPDLDEPRDIKRYTRKNYRKAEVAALDNAKAGYWSQLKHEFYLLVCTTDRKYTALRRKLTLATKRGNETIVGLIAAAFASTLGVTAGVISVLVAVLLASALTLGVHAYCALQKSDQALSTSREQ